MPEESHNREDIKISRHTEEQHLQSAECWLKTQAVCKTFQPNEDTFNANVVIGNEESHSRENITNNAILRGLNSCSPQNDCKIAFTLAEVLITLGIIGVVAALTLPTLIENYQKQVYVTQLKKVVNTMENNSRKILADEGGDSLFDTPLYTADPNDSDSYLLNSDYFEKHYKVTKLPETSEYVKSNKDIFYEYGDFLKEPSSYYFDFGACITVSCNGIRNTDRSFALAVDTNCIKQPNKTGYDRFYIVFNGKGLIYNAESDNIPSDLCYEYKDLDDTGSWLFGGNACYHKIVEDGWQIKY